MGGMIISFLFGLMWGSFLNVVIYRFGDWISIIKEPSHCRNCKKKILWYDLIPVLSFILLRGRCRHCQEKISWQYPIVELATGALIAAGYWLIFVNQTFDFWRAFFAAVSYILLIGLVIIILFQDLQEMLIPDSLAYLLVAVGLVFGSLYHGSLTNALYGGLFAILPIALLVYPSRGVWMGEGDVKVALALGFIVGWPMAVAMIALSFIIGGVFGAIALITRSVKLRSAVPFAPFLIIGSLIALFWGQFLISWYLGGLNYGWF